MAVATGGLDPFLTDAAVYLAAAVVAVPLAKRFKLGSVLGFLAAGAIIGPSGLGLIGDAESVKEFAEFGVVLLLFVIGLELKPSRLWRLRGEIFGVGLLQVAVTGIVIIAALVLSGLAELRMAIAAAAGLALSSTAFAIQILHERGELSTRYGDRAFSILLFQDLAIVPLIALVAFLAPVHPEGAAPLGQRLGIAFAALAGLVIVGRYGLRPLFTFIARSRADEAFAAAALLVVVGAALAMQAAGLSMAMGAFIAGVLLAESEYRHQVEADIEPYRGLLLGLFFIGVGMRVDWGVVGAFWHVVIFGALGLFAIKAAILYAIARVFGSSRPEAIQIAATIGQAGEFAFVLFDLATRVGAMEKSENSVLAAIVIATMAMTPIAVLIAARATRLRAQTMDGLRGVEDAQAAPVLVVGFGRFGQVVARILRLRGYEVTLIDNDPGRIRIAESFGTSVFFGDVRRGDVMRAAGAAEAKAIFICVDDESAALAAVRSLRKRVPGAAIVARTRDRFSELEMHAAGADIVVREMFESSVLMAREGLEILGDGAVAEELIDEFRRNDAELLRLQTEFGAVEGVKKLRENYSLSDT